VLSWLLPSWHGDADDASVPATVYDDGDLSQQVARFAANLRRARSKARLSQEELAHSADMHRTALSRLERCERAPEFRTLLRLARALEMTPAALLRGVR
jgi:ribosome-binding protein aMBF1 (putative translation factor)